MKGLRMFKITDNNGWTMTTGSKKKCMDFVKKQLAFRYEPMSLEKWDGNDWFTIKRVL